MNVQIVLWVCWCWGVWVGFSNQLISHSFRAVHARHASAQVARWTCGRKINSGTEGAAGARKRVLCVTAGQSDKTSDADRVRFRI